MLPTVTVLPRDDAGRILLVRQKDGGQWTTIGGSVEPDESPERAVIREAQEEAGIDVRLTGIVAALGGPEYRLVYGNGDQVACVPIVFEARVEAGTARPDDARPATSAGSPPRTSQPSTSTT